MHNIHDAEENYLEALVVLHRSMEAVHSVDVARYLELSRASVSNAMKKLEAEGHVQMMADGRLELTESGKNIGEEIDERHRTLRAWFLKLGIAEEVADQDACRIEHVLSQETFDALKAHFLKTE